ncbi:SLBB domain-containing protein [Fontimonas sp. SYSU GA230001]|uniref:polysaccharide biosynthesis/export family protein n=1 Tax=Fontimonas sp. SYSU GA230001 TaxID=3142450 RepID=UPI0032B3E4FD
MSFKRLHGWLLGALVSTVALAQEPAFLFQQTPDRPLSGMSTSLSPASPAPAPTPRTTEPAAPDRTVDESVFGASLFKGRFAQQSFRGFNPDYLVSAGDVIDLKLWGAYDLVLRLEVDSQGNIFVPKVGPIHVSNTRNGSLNAVVTEAVKKVFRDNVGVYASLANAEPVKVFVTGNVNAPGLYGAWASDSLLHFLDRAGGINTDTGSFLDITVRRSGQEVTRVNLYDFLVRGELPLIQFRDGDTIVVGPRKATARVAGAVNHPAQFEFDGRIALGDLLALAGVDGTATHVQVVRNQTPERQVEYLPLTADLRAVAIVSGDEVSVYADRQVGSIITSVEGEFQGVGQYVFPYESTLADLLKRITPTPRSDLGSVQIYRQSIAERQKQALDEMLRRLEQSVLTARSGTREEAELRAREAEIVLKFIDRARQIVPQGRLVLHKGFDPASVDLQDRDVIRIPRKTNTVAVQGEVFFPNAFVYREGKPVSYYIEQAGGLTQNGSKDRIFLVRPSGEMVEARDGWLLASSVQPGDEIMVLPKVDSKNFQFSKELVQVIYQLALSAGVVLRL